MTQHQYVDVVIWFIRSNQSAPQILEESKSDKDVESQGKELISSQG
jgi:hypothetical protein